MKVGLQVTASLAEPNIDLTFKKGLPRQYINKKKSFLLLLLQTFNKNIILNSTVSRLTELFLFIHPLEMSPHDRKALLSLPGAITLNHSGGGANLDWCQPHSNVAHALSNSEARKENTTLFLEAPSYFRNLPTQGTPCRLDLPTTPPFHAFATQNLHIYSRAVYCSFIMITQCPLIGKQILKILMNSYICNGGDSFLWKPISDCIII